MYKGEKRKRGRTETKEGKNCVAKKRKMLQIEYSGCRKRGFKIEVKIETKEE